MKRKMLLLGLVASLAISSTTWAQVPAVPAAPIAAPAAPGNLWSFLLPNAEQTANCKTHYCNSAIGQMVNGLAGPFSLMSGGLIKNRCLQNSILNDLKKPADSPAGAAARIAADEADAKARRESVRALGLVDCNYWPEAIGVLATSLRGDRNECVRFEAALALRNGCCCNKAIVKALEMCVSGSNADGFPAERSDRVRAVAAEALARCPIIETEIEKSKDNLTKNMLSPNVDPADYYKKVAMMPNDQVIASARATLASLQRSAKGPTEGSAAATSVGGPIPAIHQRAGSLAGIVSNAFGGHADPQTRMPFFTGLTRSLTGKQENTVQQYVVPSSNNGARLPEIHTTSPSEITAPLPVGEVSSPPREKSNLAPIEIVPNVEIMNPPRDKKPAAPRDLPLSTPPNNSPAAFGRPLDAKSAGEYIQVSPHVRQLQQPGNKTITPVEMFPATPFSPTSPTILPAMPIPAPAAPAANFTVVNIPPMAPNTTGAPLGQVRESRPTLPPDIVQTTSGQARESRGTVTIEIGER